MSRKRTGLRNKHRRGLGTYCRNRKSESCDRYGAYTLGRQDRPDVIAGRVSHQGRSPRDGWAVGPAVPPAPDPPPDQPIAGAPGQARHVARHVNRPDARRSRVAELSELARLYRSDET
jgi:hypothetical protein